MKLFKSRLIETGKILIGVLGILIISGIFTGLLFGLDWLLNWLWEPLNEWFFATFFIGFILFSVLKGLYWLFIEPFRKKKE